MTVPHPFYALLITALPEVMMSLCALCILFTGTHRKLDRLSPLGGFSNLLAVTGSLATLIPIGFFYYILAHENGGKWIEHPGIHLDATVLVIKAVLVLLCACTVVLLREEQALPSSSDSSPHKAELPALFLLCTVGLMLLTSATHLLVAFLALELSSLPLYLLSAFKTDSPRTASTALRSFLFNGISSAFFLFGLSLIYGLCGSLYLKEISLGLSQKGADPLVLTALVFIVGGLGVKLHIVPFHLCTPTLYKEAPTPTSAFLSSASTLAVFYFLATLLTSGLPSAAGNPSGISPHLLGWKPLLALLSLFSMAYGSFAALTQRQLRPLLAYSGLVQSGYLLMGLLVVDSIGLGPLVFYALFYAVTLLGIFAVISVGIRTTKGDDELAALNLLSKQSPFLGIALAGLLLSWVGIPPLAGFTSKFYLFSAAFQLSCAPLPLAALVGVGILTSLITLCTFLPLFKTLFVRKSNPSTPEGFPPIQFFKGTNFLLTLLLLLILWGGCFPQFFINLISPR